MTAIVALILSLMYTVLKPIHLKNEAIYNKKAILTAIAGEFEIPPMEMSDDEVLTLFADNVNQSVMDMEGNMLTPEEVKTHGYKGGLAEDVSMEAESKKPEADRILPIYEFGEGDRKFYILSVRGGGLWDAIWGFIAFEKDLNTIAGVSFDHKAETPGLGAEIKDNSDFMKQFKQKKIFDNGVYRSILVRKGGAKDPTFEVDAISGATITGDGVSEMLERGLRYYIPFMKSIKG